jgi:hypothetical protein
MPRVPLPVAFGWMIGFFGSMLLLGSIHESAEQQRSGIPVYLCFAMAFAGAILFGLL